MLILQFVACDVTKKGAKSLVSPSPPTTDKTAPQSAEKPVNINTNSFQILKPSDGIYAPGNEELTAIQSKYKEVTLDKLKEGYMIYTEGACIGCHEPNNIYQFKETEWPEIIHTMARKARISDAQKDAVFKYVMSIKATQQK